MYYGGAFVPLTVVFLVLPVRLPAVSGSHSILASGSAARSCLAAQVSVPSSGGDAHGRADNIRHEQTQHRL